MNSSKDEKKVNASSKDATKEKSSSDQKKISSSPKKGQTAAPAHNKK